MPESKRHGPGFDTKDLPSGWWELADLKEAAELESELAREVPPGHSLHRVSVRAMACRRHRKDVVFWLPEPGIWALVHLTWTVEHDPRWPSATICETWSEVVEELADKGTG